MLKFITDYVNPQVSSDLFSGRYSRKQILERAEKLIEKPLSEAEARIAEKCDRSTTEPPKPHRVLALVIHRYFGIIEQEVVVGIGLRDRMNALGTIGSEWIVTCSLSVLNDRRARIRSAMEEIENFQTELAKHKNSGILGRLVADLASSAEIAKQRFTTRLEILDIQQRYLEEEVVVNQPNLRYNYN
jgi:hypothetical protein